ncbi:hypothetical protein E2C01_006877 [Portunus trituberculatus]|uniref:Uncharacterized protein n=1 Tax=Portunus trituberculatus TaxID=210409 RepID=A0A5B7CZC0_PORTR|nr:hypothetical protein [Portunus trituberculatus]
MVPLYHSGTMKSYKAVSSADGEYPLHTNYRNLTFSTSGMIASTFFSPIIQHSPPPQDLQVRQKKSNHRFSIVPGGRHLGG